MSVPTSCTSMKTLAIDVDPGYPLRAPLQVTCRGAPCEYPRVVAVLVFSLRRKRF